LPSDKHSSFFYQQLVASDSTTFWQALATLENSRVDRKSLPGDKHSSLLYQQLVASDSATLWQALATLENSRLDRKKLARRQTL
jgi:hypothetical protein